ncbi:hypothetical protein STTU_1338 [Streptomyces sp. Tu6071]|nr:hypothetical protein STTU_1338 [Streptomyces sp. Tu6071]
MLRREVKIGNRRTTRTDRRTRPSSSASPTAYALVRTARSAPRTPPGAHEPPASPSCATYSNAHSNKRTLSVHIEAFTPPRPLPTGIA